jgi:hypothetical protein
LGLATGVEEWCTIAQEMDPARKTIATIRKRIGNLLGARCVRIGRVGSRSMIFS